MKTLIFTFWNIKKDFTDEIYEDFTTALFDVLEKHGYNDDCNVVIGIENDDE